MRRPTGGAPRAESFNEEMREGGRAFAERRDPGAPPFRTGGGL
ncbi:hypothetical protein [uncultured Thermomonospora sp.]|nr:hypothetical protein [uncultured Thermomonospora sp.]